MAYQEDYPLDRLYQEDRAFNSSEPIIGDLGFFGRSLHRKHDTFRSGPHFPRGSFDSDPRVQTFEEGGKLTLREDDREHVGTGSFRVQNR